MFDEHPFHFYETPLGKKRSRFHSNMLFLFYRKCQTCHRKKSLRTGSFFKEFPRVSLGKILLTIFLWSRRELRSTVAEYLSLSKKTVGKIYTVLRCYCGRDLHDRPVIPFGGPLYVVKCDESQFAHKSKVQLYYKSQFTYYKTKYIFKPSPSPPPAIVYYKSLATYMPRSLSTDAPALRKNHVFLF